MKVDVWMLFFLDFSSLIFDFVETATLVACINKFLHTRSLAVFIFHLSSFIFSLKNAVDYVTRIAAHVATLAWQGGACGGTLCDEAAVCG